MSYLCPLCQQRLTAHENSFACPQGHRFDLAREGYVNLLPVQHKRSKDPGDSAAMIQARRAFLEEGHYAPLREAICQQLDVCLPQARPTLLDIGCGEGYYTDAFGRVVHGRGGRSYGLDVSKAAVRAAAKRYPDIHFCVASSQRLPFGDSSLDAVIRIYAPCNGEELARVVKPGGVVITAAPAPRHLIELKALIYPQVKLHPESQEVLPGFQLADSLSLNYMLKLSGQAATALLQMTPFAWHASEETWRVLAASAVFPCEADFVIRVWRRDELSAGEVAPEDLAANSH